MELFCVSKECSCNLLCPCSLASWSQNMERQISRGHETTYENTSCRTSRRVSYRLVVVYLSDCMSLIFELLTCSLSERRHLEYRRFKVRGTFDHSRELYLSPRSLIVDNAFRKKQTFIFPSGQPEKPDLGVYVVTPFKLADREWVFLMTYTIVIFKTVTWKFLKHEYSVLRMACQTWDLDLIRYRYNFKIA